MSEELKPCPFCGGKAVLEKTFSKGDWIVFCRNLYCRLEVRTYRIETREKAIEIWNTRAKED